MFGLLQPQCSLWETSMLHPPAKLAALKKTWAWTFREEALPLIDGALFRPLYCADNVRPSKPVELVVGVLILKDMFDLTDAEALYRLDFDLGWQVALWVESLEAHCCQKTLHNFRARLTASDGGLVLFTDTVGKVIAKLGVSTRRQRMDSTHFLSNIAHLTRLGLFCETIRVFLEEVSEAYPERYATISAASRGRYRKEDGEASGYADGEESFAPVVVKPPKQVGSDSMQTPHDPTLTYNGHKGQDTRRRSRRPAGMRTRPRSSRTCRRARRARATNTGPCQR